MTTRRRNTDTPGLADLEGAASPAEAPGIMPPPGTEAQIETKVRYNRTIVEPEEFYSRELRELAAGEDSDNNLPTPAPQTDPLTEFCTTWHNFAGYSLRVVRLPDPANKRMPGQAYNNTCLEVTALGSLPFDPDNIVPTLQLINGNSGGAFRLFLSDENGQPIPGARLDRILIPDPPKPYNDRLRTELADFYPQPFYQRHQREPQPTPAPPPQKSESEQRLDSLKDSLFEKLLIRALDPPTPPTPDPLSALSPEDRLALGLLQRGDVLENAVTRIANLAQAPDRMESATWKDKLADAGIQLVTHNPQVVATATDILSRLVMALASAFAPRGTQPTEIAAQPIPVQHPQPQRVTPQIPRPVPPAQAITGLPETPQPEDEHLDDNEDEIDLVEDIVKLLLSDKPLSLDDPLISELQADYPEIFGQVMLGISQMQSITIIQYVCGKSDFCADLFNSQRNGPYLRQRLEEFKRLLIQPAPPVANDTSSTAPAPEENAEQA